MVWPSVSGPESHWGVSQYLEYPWLLEAYAETVRLMRVFVDEDPREIRAHEEEFFGIMFYMEPFSPGFVSGFVPEGDDDEGGGHDRGDGGGIERDSLQGPEVALRI